MEQGDGGLGGEGLSCAYTAAMPNTVQTVHCRSTGHRKDLRCTLLLRRYSFVVDPASCKLGPYDREHDDPFAPGAGMARPCLAFFEGATLVVDLEARPVIARFTAGANVWCCVA